MADLTPQLEQRYQFTGRVIPERAVVGGIVLNDLLADIPELSWSGTVGLSVQASQISVTFEGPSVADIQTLKNAAQNLAQEVLDVLGYRFGRSYLAEITAVLDSGNNFLVFGVDLAHVEATESKRPLTWEQVLQLSHNNPQLRRALADLREAARNPLDTGFYCKRATEAIRNHFGSDEPTAWAEMRAALNLQKVTLNSLGRFGNPQRHGHVASMSGVERVTDMNLAWEIVDRFITYLESGGEELSTTRYPLL